MQNLICDYTSAFDFGPAELWFGYGIDQGLNSAPLNSSAYTEGNSEEPGIGDRQFTVGLRHRF